MTIQVRSSDSRGPRQEEDGDYFRLSKLTFARISENREKAKCDLFALAYLFHANVNFNPFLRPFHLNIVTPSLYNLALTTQCYNKIILDSTR